MGNYCVVLTEPGPDASATTKLAEAFKMDADKFAAQVLAKIPLVIRKGLDQNGANELSRKLNALGFISIALPDDGRRAQIRRNGAVLGPVPADAVKRFLIPGDEFRSAMNDRWEPWDDGNSQGDSSVQAFAQTVGTGSTESLESTSSGNSLPSDDAQASPSSQSSSDISEPRGNRGVLTPPPLPAAFEMRPGAEDQVVEWFLSWSDTREGPHTLVHARERVSSMGVRGYCWKAGMESWVAISACPELAGTATRVRKTRIAVGLALLAIVAAVVLALLFSDSLEQTAEVGVQSSSADATEPAVGGTEASAATPVTEGAKLSAQLAGSWFCAGSSPMLIEFTEDEVAFLASKENGAQYLASIKDLAWGPDGVSGRSYEYSSDPKSVLSAVTLERERGAEAYAAGEAKLKIVTDGEASINVAPTNETPRSCDALPSTNNVIGSYMDRYRELKSRVAKRSKQDWFWVAVSTEGDGPCGAMRTAIVKSAASGDQTANMMANVNYGNLQQFGCFREFDGLPDDVFVGIEAIDMRDAILRLNGGDGGDDSASESARVQLAGSPQESAMIGEAVSSIAVDETPQEATDTSSLAGKGVSATENCSADAPIARSPEEKYLVGNGRRFLTGRSVAMHDSAGMTIAIEAALGFDGQCRPDPYQVYVFRDGEQIGTVSPSAMSARTDGAVSAFELIDSRRLRLTVDRYKESDPKCCPSTRNSQYIDLVREGNSWALSTKSDGQGEQSRGAGAPTASFDCGVARTSVEVAICGSETLRSLDGRMGLAYARAIEIAPAVEAQSLRGAQRQWIRDRQAKCGGEGDCLEKMLEARLAELKAMSVPR